MEERADPPLTLASRVAAVQSAEHVFFVFAFGPSWALLGRFLFLKSPEGETVALKGTNNSVLGRGLAKKEGER